MADRSDIEAIEQWMRTFGWEPEHALHVRDLVLQFFDQLRPLHGLDEEARWVLEAAAVVHDIGFSIDDVKHHKHSYKLIRAGEFPGFQPSQQEVIANLARYHRKAHPKPTHKGFARLSTENRELVQRLAPLLRLADGLDRSHTASVRTVDCRLHGRRLVVGVSGAGEVGFDVWGAQRKRGLFEEVYGLEVVLAHSQD
jgi:exopolyphosphatase/guanosine-5'-triphosphate,3'-diphosphate pyrophosphatase